MGSHKINIYSTNNTLRMVIHHNCGLVVAHELRNAYSLIHYLQHRGREATGIAAIGESIDVIKWKGPVTTFDLKDLHKIFDGSKYHTYFAHVRYATRGRKDKILEDAHPHVIGGKVDHRGNHILIRDCDAAIIHNGQVKLENMLEGENDTQALLRYYMKYSEQAILENISGAYTVAIADNRRKKIIVLRDRHGMKPGVLGEKGGKSLITSEDIALRKNQADFIEDLIPGSAYYISAQGKVTRKKIVEPEPKHCFFEYNYIANVDSVINHVSVKVVRRILGEMLAAEHQPEGIDLVSYIPRCPEDAARTYAQKRELEFKPVFYKQRAERSFQGSDVNDRNASIQSNLGVLPQTQGSTLDEVLSGKTLYVVDDSTIRGNASKYAIQILKKAGVENIHIANYTPKIGIVGADGQPRGCEYGVDMPVDDNFIVRDGDGNKTSENINQELGAQVYFLSVKGMLEGFRKAGILPEHLCTYCIGGERPF